MKPRSLECLMSAGKVIPAMISVMWLAGCLPQPESTSSEWVISDSTRIVSISAATTEILCELGFASNIVGLDITSTYPDSIQDRPKVGYNRNLSFEGLMSLEPDLVIGIENLIMPGQLDLLRQTGLELLLFEQEFTCEGAFRLIREISDTLGLPERGAQIVGKIKADLTCLTAPADTPIVLFIYARGAGALSVAGRGTQVEDIIGLAGGRHPELDYDGFKPLSPEILVEVNPRIILMFETGLESLDGTEGLMQVPGMAETDAGKTGTFLSMDGVLLTSYGPRLGEAACELNQKILTALSAE